MNFRSLVTLRSMCSGGAFVLGRRAKILYPLKLRWRDGSIKIGDKLSTRCGVVIDAQSGTVTIGNNVSLNDYVVLLGHGDISIGNDVRIAAHVVVSSFEHGIDDLSVPIRLQTIVKKRVVIEDDVWIGSGAKILAGAHLARGSVIGANSVVKGATIENGVYVGAPARLVKLRGANASSRTKPNAIIE